MPDQQTYALYAWGSFIRETGLDRLDGWLDPAVLGGERLFDHPDVTIYEAPLRVDVSRSLFETGDGYVEGREFQATADWRIGYLRLDTDGTPGDAHRVVDALAEQDVELEPDPAPVRNPVPVGEPVAVWEDPHGQWDLAVVRL